MTEVEEATMVEETTKEEVEVSEEVETEEEQMETAEVEDSEEEAAEDEEETEVVEASEMEAAEAEEDTEPVEASEEATEEQEKMEEVEVKEETPAEETPAEEKPAETAAEPEPEEAEIEIDESNYTTPKDLEENENMKKMFVGNVPKESTDEEIKEYFGGIEGVELAELDIVRNNNKCFGFLTFAKCDDVDDVLQKRPHKLKGRELHVKRSVPKDDQSDTAHLKSKKLFLGNIPPGMTKNDVKKYLVTRHPSKYGKITDIALVKKKDGEKEVNKGFGFIVCENEDLADRISMGDRNCRIGGEKDQEIKKARPKENQLSSGRGRGARGGFAPRGGARGSPRGGARGAARGGRGSPMRGGYGPPRGMMRGGGYSAGGYGGGMYGGGYGGYGRGGWF